MDQRGRRAGPYRAALSGGVDDKRRRYCVLLSAHFGIHPWHYDRLTVGQFEAYVDAALRLEQAAKEHTDAKR